MPIVRLINPRVREETNGNLVRTVVGIDVPFGPANKPDKVYRFRPADPAKPLENQQCEVTDPDHLARFLSIPEGFEVITADPKEKAAVEKLQPAADDIAAKRVAEAKAEQRRLDEAAVRRQKKAKDSKGKKAETTTIASLDE